MWTHKSDIFTKTVKKSFARAKERGPRFQLIRILQQFASISMNGGCKHSKVSEWLRRKIPPEPALGRSAKRVCGRGCSKKDGIMGVWGGSGNLISREDLINSISSIFLHAFWARNILPTTIFILHRIQWLSILWCAGLNDSFFLRTMEMQCAQKKWIDSENGVAFLFLNWKGNEAPTEI